MSSADADDAARAHIAMAAANNNVWYLAIAAGMSAPTVKQRSVPAW
jgi:hypothetical protein